MIWLSDISQWFQMPSTAHKIWKSSGRIKFEEDMKRQHTEFGVGHSVMTTAARMRNDGTAPLCVAASSSGGWQPPCRCWRWKFPLIESGWWLQPSQNYAWLCINWAHIQVGIETKHAWNWLGLLTCHTRVKEWPGMKHNLMQFDAMSWQIWSIDLIYLLNLIDLILDLIDLNRSTVIDLTNLIDLATTTKTYKNL